MQKLKWLLRNILEWTQLTERKLKLPQHWKKEKSPPLPPEKKEKKITDIPTHCRNLLFNNPKISAIHRFFQYWLTCPALPRNVIVVLNIIKISVECFFIFKCRKNWICKSDFWRKKQIHKSKFHKQIFYYGLIFIFF